MRKLDSSKEQRVSKIKFSILSMILAIFNAKAYVLLALITFPPNPYLYFVRSSSISTAIEQHRVDI